MAFRRIGTRGVEAIESVGSERLPAGELGAIEVLEACLAEGVGAALVHAENLSEGFRDLSSGEAGAVLQKLRNYRVRFAVVAPPGSAAFSSRFGEMVAEERTGREFRIFETREDALAWLRT